MIFQQSKHAPFRSLGRTKPNSLVLFGKSGLSGCAQSSKAATHSARVGMDLVTTLEYAPKLIILWRAKYSQILNQNSQLITLGILNEKIEIRPICWAN